jgi:hypothetical protein
MARIPHIRNISGKIATLLAKHNIKMIHQLVKKSNDLLQLAKDNLGCDVPGTYCFPCECGKVCGGKTGCNITTRCKQHECHIQLNQLAKSAVVDHCTEHGYKTDFDEATVLVKSAGYIGRSAKEAI